MGAAAKSTGTIGVWKTLMRHAQNEGESRPLMSISTKSALTSTLCLLLTACACDPYPICHKAVICEYRNGGCYGRDGMNKQEWGAHTSGSSGQAYMNAGAIGAGQGSYQGHDLFISDSRHLPDVIRWQIVEPEYNRAEVNKATRLEF